MMRILEQVTGATSIEYQARVSESVLARLHFVVRMPVGDAVGTVDVRGLERELTAATRTWNDELADLLVDTDGAEELGAIAGTLPEAYKEDYPPRQALADLAALRALGDGSDLSLALSAPSGEGDDEAHLRLKIFRAAPLSLSAVLPVVADVSSAGLSDSSVAHPAIPRAAASTRRPARRMARR